MPLCPTVERLELRRFNEKIKIMKKDEDGDGQVMDMASSGKLRQIETDDLGWLKSLPVPAAFQSLSTLRIFGDDKVENMREVEDVFRSCCSSLQSLVILNCRELRSVSGALEHLTALQSLTILIHHDMMKDEMKRRIEEEDEIPWTALQHSLHTLEINYMPRGLRHLTSLQTLLIMDGNHIKMIPEWFTSLSSLNYLEISDSSLELRRRCKRPDGADWPKIRHIHRIDGLNQREDKKCCNMWCL